MVYKVISTIFSKSGLDVGAPEAHGMATGMLCADDRIDGERWLAELTHQESTLDENGKSLLLRLFEETRRLLLSDGFEFELFLPEENESLITQVEALKLWCQGFLFGVGAGSVIPESEWPEDVRDIVRDITEFTKLESIAQGEEDENAFSEICEYLRTVVVLLHDDLHDLMVMHNQ